MRWQMRNSLLSSQGIGSKQIEHSGANYCQDVHQDGRVWNLVDAMNDVKYMPRSNDQSTVLRFNGTKYASGVYQSPPDMSGSFSAKKLAQ